MFCCGSALFAGLVAGSHCILIKGKTFKIVQRIEFAAMSKVKAPIAGRCPKCKFGLGQGYDILFCLCGQVFILQCFFSLLLSLEQSFHCPFFLHSPRSQCAMIFLAHRLFRLWLWRQYDRNDHLVLLPEVRRFDILTDLVRLGRLAGLTWHPSRSNTASIIYRSQNFLCV